MKETNKIHVDNAHTKLSSIMNTTQKSNSKERLNSKSKEKYIDYIANHTIDNNETYTPINT